jgi:hypothetical protein
VGLFLTLPPLFFAISYAPSFFLKEKMGKTQLKATSSDSRFIFVSEYLPNLHTRTGYMLIRTNVGMRISALGASDTSWRRNNGL